VVDTWLRLAGSTAGPAVEAGVGAGSK